MTNETLEPNENLPDKMGRVIPMFGLKKVIEEEEEKRDKRKRYWKKIRNPFIIIFGLVLLICLLIIVFISPIAKHLIEKYDEKYTGRQISMDWIYLNPFTGYIHFENLKINEYKSDSVFFFTQGLSANLSMYKLLSKNYEISSVVFQNPRGTVIQNKKSFNFDDVVEKFRSKDSIKEIREIVHFSIVDIEIKNGEFYYIEESIPIHYWIKNVNITCSGKRWDTDTVSSRFSLLPGSGTGKMSGYFKVNVKNDDYEMALQTQELDLSLIEQYLKDFINYGKFTAKINSDIRAKGNFKEREDITISGLIEVLDFHFGKTKENDFAAFDQLVVDINQVSPKKHKYDLDSISVNKPYFRYEQYDYSDNLQTMFGNDASNIYAAAGSTEPFNLVIEIAQYVKALARNFFKSNYEVGRVAIYKANIQYDDYTLSEKFSLALNPLTIESDSIGNQHRRVEVKVVSGIQPYGQMNGVLSINPKDSSDFDLNYNFQNLPISMFNPFTIAYTSYPLDRGTIEVKGEWHVRNGEIESKNHLIVIDPRVSEKTDVKRKRWIPMPLVMAVVREGGNVIDYEVPIRGNLKNPKFHLRDIVFDVIQNIFVKPVITPYRLHVKNLEREIEKSLVLKWNLREANLLRDQKNFVEKIVKFLKENPEAGITVVPQNFSLKEKEYIILYEAKKRYYLKSRGISAKNFSDIDAENVEKLSIKDSFFNRYLNDNTDGKLVFTIQEKCTLLLGNSFVSKEYQKLNKAREDLFLSYFKEAGLLKQIKLANVKAVIPYNGFSYYKISYKNAFPDFLLNAYKKMSRLNEDAPRNRFQKTRNRFKKNTDSK